jgi:GrpB-like predicted nucleotidyltransferase (UPF0157 family)
MLVFRERLRHSPEDRLRYEAIKRELVAREWPDMNAYADARRSSAINSRATSVAGRGTPSANVDS